MIKIENVEVVGWEHTIRGMRNPKNSWDMSDSSYGCDYGGGSCTYCSEADCDAYSNGSYVIGPNDHKLMTALANGGPVHAKYRRMIVAYLDITAPLYWWKEFDTYKVGTVANSCSTMHKIHDKEFTLDDFSHEHLYSAPVDRIWLTSAELDEESGCGHKVWSTPLDILRYTIEMLNVYRNEYLDTKSKEDWWQMIQLLPSSYNQKRTVMLNYEVLVGMYKWRKNHKLDEWCEFCKWIESLPYSELITGK